MRKRIGIAMPGALAIGTIWSFGYDWKIAAIVAPENLEKSERM